MTIAIDFDGTIVEHRYPKIGKIKADMFIDDRNFGGLPDWGTIYQMVTNHETWESRNFSNPSFTEQEQLKKKHWWNF